MGRLFGTDGARGVANSEISCELAMNIGKAAAMVLCKYKNIRALATSLVTKYIAARSPILIPIS